MNTFSDAGFDRESSFGGAPSALIELMNQFRSAFDPRTTQARVPKGDVRAAVLNLLAEQPMHGYQIIQEIAERSGGAWKPSAGSVYPTLQLLADEGLIEAVENNGRKTYSLTEAGSEHIAAASSPAPWDAAPARDTTRFTALPRAGVDLAAAATQVAHSGTPEQVQQAVAILEETRRSLYALLAQE